MTTVSQNLQVDMSEEHDISCRDMHFLNVQVALPSSLSTRGLNKFILGSKKKIFSWETIKTMTPITKTFLQRSRTASEQGHSWNLEPGKINFFNPPKINFLGRNKQRRQRISAPSSIQQRTTAYWGVQHVVAAHSSAQQRTAAQSNAQRLIAAFSSVWQRMAAHSSA